MDFDPVSGRAAFHGATPIPMEDMTPQLPVHGPGTPSQIERSAISGDSDHIDDPVTEDLFEGARSQSRTCKDRNTALCAGFDCNVGVDDHRHLDRHRFRIISGVKTVSADGDQGQRSPFRHRQLLMGKDDLIGFLVHSLSITRASRPSNSPQKLVASSSENPKCR